MGSPNLGGISLDGVPIDLRKISTSVLPIVDPRGPHHSLPLRPFSHLARAAPIFQKMIVLPQPAEAAALTGRHSAGDEIGSTRWWSYGLGTSSMMVSSVVVTVFALLTALRPNPWYDPSYAIPLLGMILGNCMTGIALGLDTLTTSLVSRRAGVEAQLMLGATRQAAVAPVTRQALRSALMPTINSMAATGVVSLPGMMTGQILGGVPPAEAVKYQILVMFLIAGGTGLGAVTAVLGGVYRLTDGRHRLRLDRLRPPKPA